MLALLLITTALIVGPQDTLGGTATRNVVAIISGSSSVLRGQIVVVGAGDTVVVMSRRDGVERRATTVLGKRS